MAGKERSPNYPAVSLESAVQMIRKVYDKERRTAVATDLVGKALGHPNLSGSALTKIGALRQYGLLENVERGKVKVSEDAMSVLLRKSDDPEYTTAVRHLALTPPLFRDLYRDFGSASNDALHYNLVKERNFSEEGAERVIKAFRATIAFAKLGEGEYSSEEVEAPVEDLFEEESPMTSVGPSTVPNRAAVQVHQPTGGGGGKAQASMALTYILPGGVNAQLTFGSDPTPRAIQRLIDYLGMLKDDLPEPQGATGREDGE